MWRLAHNIHPLYLNIERKRLQPDTRCTVCHMYFEDGRHLFLKCKYIKQIWLSLELEEVRLKLIPCRSAVEVLHY
jgi:hypothetical protein